MKLKFTMRRAVQLQREKGINILIGSKEKEKYQNLLSEYFENLKKLEVIEGAFGMEKEDGITNELDAQQNVIFINIPPQQEDNYNAIKREVKHFIDTYKSIDLLARWDTLYETIEYFTEEEVDLDKLSVKDLENFEEKLKLFIETHTKPKKVDKKKGKKEEEEGKS